MKSFVSGQKILLSDKLSCELQIVNLLGCSNTQLQAHTLVIVFLIIKIQNPNCFDKLISKRVKTDSRYGDSVRECTSQMQWELIYRVH